MWWIGTQLRLSEGSQPFLTLIVQPNITNQKYQVTRLQHKKQTEIILQHGYRVQARGSPPTQYFKIQDTKTLCFTKRNKREATRRALIDWFT